ncbi:MAG: NYN domain-containing protein [Gemmatimonadales bacterium]|jgi:hypothetical protein|nr:NYN domain-containing protein [Gemmatimonadales bacterium]
MTRTIHLPPHASTSSGCRITAPRPGCARLHLLDLDNLHGCPDPNLGRVDRVHFDYETIGIGPIDLVYGACNHDPTGTDRLSACRLYHLCQTWGQATIRPARGPDGADNSLIADAAGLLDAEDLGQRFDDVVIGSGDHIFEFTARRLRRAGLKVHLVVASCLSLSRELERAADGCIWLLPDHRCVRHTEPRTKYALAA